MATTADTSTETEYPQPKGTPKLAFVLSAVLLLAGAGMGFFGISTGIIPLGKDASSTGRNRQHVTPRPDVAFVPIPTLIITLPPEAQNRHLRFSAQIEVPEEFQGDVEYLMPRIQDLMNGYLRALNADDIEGAGALFEIRLQLFRRIVMVVGLGKANGLLVTEFILN